jgi:glycosyltransferase involved in cell wall biosynthesis
MNSVNKILYVIGSGNIGGREKFLYELVSEQKKNDKVSPEVLFLSGKGYFFDNIKSLGIPVHFAGGYHLLKYLKVKKIFLTYDKIIFFTFGVTVFLASTGLKKKLIYNLHGRLYANPFFKRKIPLTQTAPFQIDEDVEKTKPSKSVIKNIFYKIDGGINFFRRYFKHRLIRIFFKKIDKFIVASNYLKNYLNEQFGIDDGRINVIPNFINLDNIKPQLSPKEIRKELNLSENSFIIGFAGRFDKRKGLERLICAFAKIVQENKIDVSLVLVGNGEPVKKNLQRLVNKNHIDDKVLFTGTKLNVYDYVNTFNVFVLPSYDENFGLSLIEAMALKRPVIAFSDSGGPAEIIKNKINGLIVEDVEGLAKSILNLYQDFSLREKIAVNAAESCKIYDSNKLVKSYTDTVLSD